MSWRLKGGRYEIFLTAQIRAWFWDVSWCEMVASQCRIALERLCSEAADENDETCLNIGWNVKIIRCKVAHYRILHIYSRPFSPCTLLWQPAVASLLAHSSFFLPSFFNPYCICWLIRLFKGTITLCFVFFSKEGADHLRSSVTMSSRFLPNL